MSKSKDQSGFTLLEVLIAIIVISIGLLGLAGVMASSMKNSHSAYHRTQATWLAYDIIDRMRVNRAAAIATSDNYNIDFGDTTSSSSGLAGADVTAWKTMLSDALPAGDGEIIVDENQQVKITIQWNDSRGSNGKSAEKFIVNSQL